MENEKTFLQIELDRRIQASGLSRRKVCELAGVGQTVARDIIDGISLNPRPSTLIKLANVLNCSANDLDENITLEPNAAVYNVTESVPREQASYALEIDSKLLTKCLDRAEVTLKNSNYVPNEHSKATLAGLIYAKQVKKDHMVETGELPPSESGEVSRFTVVELIESIDQAILSPARTNKKSVV
jgi:transcriptional regulator with XRE-family HTH domain